MQPDQGVRNNTQDEAIRVAGENADFGISDLYEAIETGDYPSWTVYFQIMDPKRAETFKCKIYSHTAVLLHMKFALFTDNIFDLTKEWLVEDVPLQEVGRITLTHNP